ncbi:MAG: hypothetical protein LBE57_00390 [Methanosarcinales archaeon]|nr:hypothetical protein [Methanosarcinales archaeon]
MDKNKKVNSDQAIKKKYLRQRNITLSAIFLFISLGSLLIFWIVYWIIIDFNVSSETVFYTLLAVLFVFTLIILGIIFLLLSYRDYGRMMKKYINDKYIGDFPVLKITLINQNVICGKIENIFNRTNLILMDNEKIFFSKWDYIVTIEETEPITDFSSIRSMLEIVEECNS